MSQHVLELKNSCLQKFTFILKNIMFLSLVGFIIFKDWSKVISFMIQFNPKINSKITNFSGNTPAKTTSPAQLQKELKADEFVSAENKKEKKKKKAFLEGILTPILIIGGAAAIIAWIASSQNKSTKTRTIPTQKTTSSKLEEGKIEDIKKAKQEVLDNITPPKKENFAVTSTKKLDNIRKNIANYESELKKAKEAAEQAERSWGSTKSVSAPTTQVDNNRFDEIRTKMHEFIKMYSSASPEQLGVAVDSLITNPRSIPKLKTTPISQKEEYKQLYNTYKIWDSTAYEPRKWQKLLDDAKETLKATQAQVILNNK